MHNPNKAGDPWTDLTMFDYLPEELHYVGGSLAITRPGGKAESLPDGYFHEDTHTIEVPVDSIACGETYVVRYKVGVGEEEPAAPTVNKVKLEGTGEDADPKASCSIDLRPKKQAAKKTSKTPTAPAAATRLARTGDGLAAPSAALAAAGVTLLAALAARRRFA